jgi:hypothetical protein
METYSALGALILLLIVFLWVMHFCIRTCKRLGFDLDWDWISAVQDDAAGHMRSLETALMPRRERPHGSRREAKASLLTMRRKRGAQTSRFVTS